jgi:hypothetical protein
LWWSAARRGDPEQVASATGLDLIDLRVAVGRWATRLRQDGRLIEVGFTAPFPPEPAGPA